MLPDVLLDAATPSLLKRAVLALQVPGKLQLLQVSGSSRESLHPCCIVGWIVIGLIYLDKPAARLCGAAHLSRQAAIPGDRGAPLTLDTRASMSDNRAYERQRVHQAGSQVCQGQRDVP